MGKRFVGAGHARTSGKCRKDLEEETKVELCKNSQYCPAQGLRGGACDSSMAENCRVNRFYTRHPSYNSAGDSGYNSQPA